MRRFVLSPASALAVALLFGGCGGHDTPTSGLGPGSGVGANNGGGAPPQGGSTDGGVANTDGGAGALPDAGGGGFGTVEVMVTGFGSVSSRPAGISCSNDCRATFQSGTQVALVPSPAGGYVFTGWSGSCQGTSICIVRIVTGDSGTVVATFAAR